MASNQSNDKDLPKKQSIDTDIIRDFLAIQKSEIVVRQSELKIQEKEIDNNKDVALRTIQAQQDDLKDGRNHKRRNSIITKIFILILVVIVIVFVSYLIEKGKDQIAFEIIKIVGTAILAFGSGFFLGKNQSVNSTKIESE